MGRNGLNGVNGHGLGLYYDQLVRVNNGYSRPTQTEFGDFMYIAPGQQNVYPYGVGTLPGVQPPPGSYGDDYRYTSSLYGVGAIPAGAVPPPTASNEYDLGDFDWQFWIATPIETIMTGGLNLVYAETKQFVGKGRAWYDSITTAENRLVTLDNLIFAIGKAEWDAVAAAAQAEPGAIAIAPYDSFRNVVRDALKGLTGSDHETMSQRVIDTANTTVDMFGNQADYVKARVSPATAARVAGEQERLSRVLAKLPPYGSPSEAARVEFLKQLRDRTAIFAGVIGMAAMAVAAVALLGLIALKR